MTQVTLHAFPQAILHIDGDAFFTSVEQALNPELSGRPVVTGKERGIVACASYEAKALGIKRPMRIFEAKKIYPGLICLPSDYETYSLYSRRMLDILRRFTPTVEAYSIDEAFADITGLRRLYRTGYPEIALRIKQTVQKELGITVSVGLSLSKTLAKLCSKENKPDGLTVAKGYELDDFLKKIPVERVCGFGPNTAALLRKNGILRVADYIDRPEIFAKRLLGKIGIELWHELRGEMVYPFVTCPKEDYLSISKTKTFTPPSSDKNFVRAQLFRNGESAFIKLRRHRLRTGQISVYLRTQEFRSSGLEARLDRTTSSTLEAIPLIDGLFQKVFCPGTLYRATGIVLSEIESDQTSLQYCLFENPARIRSLGAVDRVIDGVNELYGKHSLHLGTTLWLGKYRQHLSDRGDLPRRKTRLLLGENFRQRLNIPKWEIRI